MHGHVDRSPRITQSMDQWDAGWAGTSWTVSIPGGAVFDVRLLEGGGFVVGEVDVERGDCLGEVVGFGGADDGRRDQRVAQYPGQGDLGHRDATRLGEIVDGVDDGFVVG